MKNVENDSLQTIVGQQLSAVCFIMDYMSLSFNSVHLHIYLDPVIKTKIGSYVRTSPDFCNQLLRCIDMKVKTAYIKDGDSMEITLGDSDIFFVSLKPEDRLISKAVEAVMYTNDATKEWWVV